MFQSVITNQVELEEDATARFTDINDRKRNADVSLTFTKSEIEIKTKIIIHIYIIFSLFSIQFN